MAGVRFTELQSHPMYHAAMGIYFPRNHAQKGTKSRGEKSRAHADHFLIIS
jgi:hypothetical protein